MTPPGPLILVVDDDPDTRELLGLTLQDLGFRVAHGLDGGDAVSKALALRPDAIVMDYTMPVVDGGEAARQLATDARTQSIPVLLLSGDPDYLSPDVRPRCAVFLPKPCEPEALGSALQRVLATAPG